MLAINTKLGMSTHVAEGTLHRFPSEFPSKSREPSSSPPSCTRMERKQRRVILRYMQELLRHTKLILTSPLTKDIDESKHLSTSSLYKSPSEECTPPDMERRIRAVNNVGVLAWNASNQHKSWHVNSRCRRHTPQISYRVPIKSREPSSSPPSCTRMERKQRRVAMRYMQELLRHTKLILTSPLTKDIDESKALVHIVTVQITKWGMHSPRHGEKNKSGE